MVKVGMLDPKTAQRGIWHTWIVKKLFLIRHQYKQLYA